jgi:predicted nucleic acid-binding protein
MVFVDASALVKRYVRERHSVKVRRLVAAGPVAVSRLSEVEVPSALARLVRERRLSTPARDRAVAAFVTDLAAWHVVEITTAVTALARTLLHRHELRAGDAIQLASASGCDRPCHWPDCWHSIRASWPPPSRSNSRSRPALLSNFGGSDWCAGRLGGGSWVAKRRVSRLRSRRGLRSRGDRATADVADEVVAPTGPGGSAGVASSIQGTIVAIDRRCRERSTRWRTRRHSSAMRAAATDRPPVSATLRPSGRSAQPPRAASSTCSTRCR